MNKETWTSVDAYLVGQALPRDPVLDHVVDACAKANLPPISVAPNQGKLLHLFARMVSAGRILEIGTLGGYSTVWLARALPADGSLITIELDERHADVAQANIDFAQLSGRVQIRRGRAIEVLKTLESTPPFDLVFIDADKESCADYFDWAVKHTRAGGVIIVDNVVRNGAVIDSDSVDPSVKGVRRFMDRLAAERRVEATAVQTVGSKGYDGFAIAMVIET